MSKSNLDFTFIPSLSCGLITGNPTHLKNSKSSCLLGVDSRGFITFTTEDNKTRQKIEAQFVSGRTADFQSALKSDNYSYKITNPINTLSSVNDMTYLSKLIYSIDTEDGICRGLDKCEIGYNQNIQMSKSGHLNGGWYNCDPRDYISYGFEGFANPFLWNKRTVGTSGNFTYKNWGFYTHYGVKQISSAVAGNPTGASTGFLSPSVPSICDFSICYNKDKNNRCPYNLTFNLQRINEGTKSDQNWTDGFNQTLEEGSATSAAINGLTAHLSQSQNTNACTGIFSTKPMKNTEFNGYCTIANFDTANTENSMISKWALGCFTRSLFKGFCLKNQCSSEFALNVGPPAYLSKEYVNGATTQSANSIPLVCEIDYTIIMGGFNIPFFLSVYNNVNGLGNDDINTSYEGSRLCICGIRPNRIITTESPAKTKTVLPCLPEGGLHEQYENE